MLVFINAKKGIPLPSCLRGAHAEYAYPKELEEDPDLKDFVQYDAEVCPGNMPEIKAFCREHGFDFWID